MQKKKAKTFKKTSKKGRKKAEERVSKVNSLMNSVVQAKKEQIYKDLSEDRPTIKKNFKANESNLEESLLKDFRYEVSLESYTDGSSSKEPSYSKNIRVTHADFIRDIDKESYALEQLKSLKKEGRLDDEGELRDGKVIVFV